MGLPKGRTNNPKGREKGSKNKITKPVVQEILDVAKKLEGDGVGLEACARANPEWFFTHIFKNVIPKNVELSGEITNTLGLSEALLEKLDEIYSHP